MHDFQNRESLWSECNIQNLLLWMSNNIFLSYCAFVFCWSWIRQVSTRLFWSLSKSGVFSFHPLNPQRFVGKLRHQTVWWVESLFFVISNNMTNHCCFAEEKQLKTWRAFSLLLWPVINHMSITKTFSVSHFSVFVFFLVHILSIFRLNNWACICLFGEKQQFFSYETWWHTWEVTGQEGFSHLQYA